MKKKILIVEDEFGIADYLSELLSDIFDINVKIAENGEDGLKEAFSFQPDLILLDIKLPKLSGIEVAKAVKADNHTKHIPIIALSALAQPEDIEKGYNSGIDLYMTKDYILPELLEKIKKYLYGEGG